MSQNPKQKTRNQHIVPQCYLRGFADGDGNFFSFNKLYQKSRRASVKSSASADFFYDLDPASLQDPADDPQWVEETFALLEQRFKEVLDAFIADAMKGEVSPDAANSMAHYIAIQWLRARGTRDTLLELNKKSMQTFIDRWYGVSVSKVGGKSDTKGTSDG